MLTDRNLSLGRLLPLLVCALTLEALLIAQPAATFGQPATDPMRSFARDLRRIGAVGRLLYVTAHPDDEDNRLLAYYAQGLGFDVTLLTLTRGEGGQNEIGDELFEALGALRSEELRSAHLYDGAVQRFSRAFEFGYSFSEEETFRKWGEEEILKDVVRVVREVRPHVICTMPVATSGGGRHHQASAYLARRAFDVAAETQWPELGAPHAVDRLFEQVWTRGSKGESLWSLPLNAFDPVAGTTWSELGFRARSFHKCQGTGQVSALTSAGRGNRWRLVRRRGPLPKTRTSHFDGLKVFLHPTSGKLQAKRWEGWGNELSRPTEINPLAIHASPTLQSLRSLYSKVHSRLKPKVLDALSSAHGLQVEARAASATVTPGASVRITVRYANRGAEAISVSASWLSLNLFGTSKPRRLIPLWQGELKPQQVKVESYLVDIPDTADAWTALKLEKRKDFDRYDSVPRGLPDLGVARVEVEAEASGWPINTPTYSVVHRTTDTRFPQAKESDLALVPPSELTLHPPVLPVAYAPGTSEVRVRSTFRVEHRRGLSAEHAPKLSLELRDPAGRSVASESMKAEGGSQEWSFSLPTNDSMPELRYQLSASWDREEGSPIQAVSLQAVDYPHIRRVFLERPAVGEIVVFPCHVPADLRIGYITGPGDLVDDCLRQIGVEVQELDHDTLVNGDLSQWKVIVTGIRAYKTNQALKQAHARLTQWREAGGHLIVLYNKTWDMNSGRGGRGGSPWTPFPARVSTRRVTVEEAEVRLKKPQHPFFQTPHQLSAKDWSNWVQERGLYFLETKDERYEDLLEIQEPWAGNRGAKQGALVTVKTGKGRWTYVGLSLFRQLPAGIPGAYRLMVNLISQPAK